VGGAFFLNAAMVEPTRSQRKEYLDLFRFLLVTLAIYSHVLATFRPAGQRLLGDVSWVHMLTRTATPSLVILFGVMLEVVYVRRAEQEGFREVDRRLFYRAVLCYFAFLGLAVAGFIGGRVSLSGLLLSPIMASSPVFASIFKLYLFLLFLSVLVVRLRLRWSVAAPLALITIVWTLDAILLRPAGSAFGQDSLLARQASHSIDFFIGIGDSYGPSVLHSLTFVGFGMALGGMLIGSRLWFWLWSLMVVVCLTIVSTEIGRDGFHGFARDITAHSLDRAHNHPVYFAYGCVAASAFLGLAWVVAKVSPAWVKAPALYLGAHTLPFFFLSNLILLPLTRTARGMSDAAGIVATLAVVFCVYWLVRAWYSRGRQLEPVRWLEQRLPFQRG
jgi:hypothetical protein